MASRKKWLLLPTILLVAVTFYFLRRPAPIPSPHLIPANEDGLAIGNIRSLGNGRWIRSFKGSDGIIYLKGRMMSRDGGQTVAAQSGVDVEVINATPEGAVFSSRKLFYALDGPAMMVRPGVYRAKAWRSTDGMKTLTEEDVLLEVPDGPKRQRKEGEWFGLYVYRTVLERPDGSWLMTMYGNFDGDNLVPPDRSSRREVKFMMRSFVLTSSDQGRSWQYLSTIAAPKPADPVGEGFVEPAMTMLKDGRLLCIIRTGHHFPLYASWSEDGGRSWSAPVYTGLDRGCDPCLITLSDGRVALSWGRRYPEGWSRIDGKGDATRFSYPGNGYVNLAVSGDGGETWKNYRMAQGTGSCYSTLMEVAPGTLFFQVDQWIWRVGLNPAGKMR